MLEALADVDAGALISHSAVQAQYFRLEGFKGHQHGHLLDTGLMVHVACHKFGHGLMPPPRPVGDGIFVIACFHSSRDPLIWQRRV